MIADSERDANMLYAVGKPLEEPMVYLRVRGRGYAVVGDRELPLARKDITGCRVVSMENCLTQSAGEREEASGLLEAAHVLLRRHRLKKIMVPENFPHGMARELRERKIKIQVSEGPIFPDRACKSAMEVRWISAALMMAEVGLAEGIQALRNSKIGKDGRLSYRNLPLTAEKLRGIINVAILQAGGYCGNTIVACGRQTSDPREQGHGVLRAHQPIVLHVFPRSRKTGYYGDIARTVVRGRASEALRKMFHTVVAAQQIGFEKLKLRTQGHRVHDGVAHYFESEGYRTTRRKGRAEGFVHAVGHGLGLELREFPRLHTNSSDRLRAGHVVTIEPGLYYHGLGGVRLEDVALITGKGPKNLTKFERVLEV